MLIPWTRTPYITTVLCISSGTNVLWPHPFIFLFPSSSSSLHSHLHLPLCLHHYDLFSKAHNHLRSYLYYPEILSCVISFANYCLHMGKCVLFAFILWCLRKLYCVLVLWMRTWLNLCKIRAFLFVALRKTLSIFVCVKTGEMCLKFWDVSLF